MNHPTATREPRWQAHHRYRRQALPAATRRWLLDQGSLTDQLVRLTGGAFQVRQLSQQWRTPRHSERRPLGLAPREVALVREVILLCHGQPWVFARSVLPAASLRGPLRHLRHLRDRSLGGLLFRQPSLRRGAFELARIEAGHACVPGQFAPLRPVWGRRSRLWIHGHELMVSEVFLEAFQPWPRCW